MSKSNEDSSQDTNATYTPPEVWQWEAELGGTWGSLNRPTAGATHETVLPVGRHPFQLYSLGTPNGQKVTILFEELLEAGETGAEYDAHLINIQKGDQFGSGFVALNPNSKIPALLDRSGDTPTRVFESGAILLHLAQKFGRFLPEDSQARTEAMSWLFWQMGSAPYVGGGFGHFYSYAPYAMQYPIDRFTLETKRQLDVLNQRLASNTYLAGDEYSIADIAVWTWYGGLVRGELYEGSATFLQVENYTHLRRWADAIAQRPAVQRGARVNRTWGENPVPERHSAADFES